MAPLNKRFWSCTLTVIYAHRSYLDRFNVPVMLAEQVDEQAMALSHGILRSIKSWGKPWSELRREEINIEFAAEDAH